MGGTGVDPAIRLQHFATRLIRIARATHKEHALSSAQYSVMALLNDQPGMSVVELARRESVAHPTMSRLISGLINRNFVSRAVDPADKRSGLLCLTARERNSTWTSPSAASCSSECSCLSSAPRRSRKSLPSSIACPARRKRPFDAIDTR